MKTVTAYICEFCPRRHPFKTARGARQHENRCYRNPATRSCATCKHFSMEEQSRNELHDGQDYEYTFSEPTCALGIIDDARTFHEEGHTYQEPASAHLQTGCKSYVSPRPEVQA